MLADDGWRILFLGTECRGSAGNLRLYQKKGVTVRQMPLYQKRLPGKLHYMFFCFWAFLSAILWRPKWIYVSDPLSCPIALFLSYATGVKILYHEHDSPNSDVNSKIHISNFMKFILWTRKIVARRARACILPNEERMKLFIRETGRRGNVFCVWNCPRLEEIGQLKKPRESKEVILYFHGNIHIGHLPLAILEAIATLPANLRLRIVGYESAGSGEHREVLEKKARSLGIAEKIEFIDAMPRHEILRYCLSSDIGLCFISKESKDINDKYKVGASNKAFDYLSCGLALLVSDLPDWKKIYAEPGYGLACDPNDTGSIASAIRWFLEHPDDMRRMGESGRQRILKEWNYESQFKRVQELFEDIS